MKEIKRVPVFLKHSVLTNSLKLDRSRYKFHNIHFCVGLTIAFLLVTVCTICSNQTC